MIRSIFVRSTRTPLKAARSVTPTHQMDKHFPPAESYLLFYYAVPRFNLNLYVEHIQSSLHAYIYIQTVHPWPHPAYQFSHRDSVKLFSHWGVPHTALSISKE